MSRHWVSLAERPDLFAAAVGIGYGDTAAGFVQHDEVGHLADPSRLVKLWPECFLVLVEDGRAIARAVMVAFSSRHRSGLPQGGWDGGLLWAVQDAVDEIEPDTACALEINVDPSHRGQGISSEAVEAMRHAATELGYSRLVAPVRPPDKAREPHTPMAEYMARTRSDGLPEDRWLRVHVRAGGRIEGVAEASMVVIGALDQWRAWTGQPLDDAALRADIGGLVPLVISPDRRIGIYVEPNVWVVHDLGK